MKNKLLKVLAGMVTGLVNGLFGGGGGMIIVPILTFLFNYKENKSHATAILIILPLSIVSGLIYASYKTFDYRLGIPVIVGVILGGFLGAKLLGKISEKWMGIIFAFAMAFVGVKMLLF